MHAAQGIYLLKGGVMRVAECLHVGILLYSQKYWWALNLAVEPKIAIARILVHLNLAVWYEIAICIYASRKFWRIF